MVGAALTEWAVLIASIGTAVAAVIGGVALVITALRTGEIRTIVSHVSGEVTALNGKTIAVLAEEDESRRIGNIAPQDRTPGEIEHLEVVPPPG